MIGFIALLSGVRESKIVLFIKSRPLKGFARAYKMAMEAMIENIPIPKVLTLLEAQEVRRKGFSIKKYEKLAKANIKQISIG